jgi:murein DD-endopeptidase MepM/ murein hydrolase activator NlpD
LPSLASKEIVAKKNPELPTRIVASKEGTSYTKPSVWTAHAKKINQEKYTIRVEEGDTVYTLSRKHGVAIRDMIQRNHLHPPFGLKAGSLLTLSNPHTHKVLKGETLYTVAKKNNVDVKALASRNHLKAPFSLKTGQELLLPAPPTLNTCVKNKVMEKPLPKTKPSLILKKEKVPTPLKRSSKLFLKPVQGPIISHYGPLANGTQNDGINIGAKPGTPVHAAENGVVVYCGNAIQSYGNLILIKHADHWVSTYAHLKNIHVQRGNVVKRGQIIGNVGNTGHVKIPQLHFELRQAHYPVDPLPHIKK